MSLTEDYTFQLGSTGVILNTDSLSLPFVDITDVSGFDNAPYRETQREHEGTDGGFMDAEFEKGRDILLTGTVYASSSTIEAYLDTLKANYAPSTTLVPFNFRAPGVVERLVFVKPLGCRYDWTSARRTGQSPIQFKMFAEDPRLYAATETTVNVPFAAVTTSGFGFNLGFSFGFGSSGGTDGVFVVNSGNRSTPVQFTINGPCDTPSILDETNGHTLTFNLSLASGETLVVNTQYKTAKLNGTLSRRNTLTSPDWFFLESGSTFIRYRALTGTGSSMDIAFRSAWR